MSLMDHVIANFSQGKFQLVIKIKNWRSVFQEYLVDLIVENWLLPINTNQSRTLTGLKDISTLTVSAQATCTNGLLCDNCTKICGELVSYIINKWTL